MAYTPLICNSVLFFAPRFPLVGCMFGDDMALMLLKNVLGAVAPPPPPVVWKTTNMQRFSRKEEAQCTCLFVPLRLLLLLIASIPPYSFTPIR
uniref:Uncharacterized protein n=1 Tax=Arundo donax TaxID=35708 RepID=A0A0A9HB39_ARUDO